MEGHNDNLRFDAILKLRLEPDLKSKVAELAKRQRKTTAQLLREKLWQIVEEDEKRGGQEELPLAPVGGAR
jgi:predicted DNA-binding protein